MNYENYKIGENDSDLFRSELIAMIYELKN